MSKRRCPRKTPESTLTSERKAELKGELSKLTTVLEPVSDATTFFQIYDKLVSTKSGFVHNRSNMLDAWHRGRCCEPPSLYTLRIYETDELSANHELMRDLAEWLGASSPGDLVIPSLLWKDYGNVCITLWVAPEFRGLGFGTRMVAKGHIKRVWEPLSESAGFWQKLQIKETDWLPPSDWVESFTSNSSMAQNCRAAQNC